MKAWGRNSPGKGNSYCKGRRMEMGVLRNRKEASEAGAERVGGGHAQRTGAPQRPDHAGPARAGKAI